MGNNLKLIEFTNILFITALKWKVLFKNHQVELHLSSQKIKID